MSLLGAVYCHGGNVPCSGLLLSAWEGVSLKNERDHIIFFLSACCVASWSCRNAMGGNLAYFDSFLSARGGVTLKNKLDIIISPLCLPFHFSVGHNGSEEKKKKIALFLLSFKNWLQLGSQMDITPFRFSVCCATSQSCIMADNIISDFFLRIVLLTRQDATLLSSGVAPYLENRRGDSVRYT